MAAAQAPGEAAKQEALSAAVAFHAEAHSEVTFETFTGYTQACGVREIQHKYLKILAAAKESGREVIDEMKVQGYEDYSAFSKACKQFDLFCWPYEFGELGSGYVLYFNFLSLLGFVLLILFLLQLPVMAAYNQEDNLCAWGGTGWRDLYATSSQTEYAHGDVCTEASSYVAIRSAWLTPGNLGPNQSSSSLVPTLYTVCVASICLIIYCAYMLLAWTDYYADLDTVAPNDFAISASGLPTTANDEESIKKFFSEHAVHGETDTEIVRVIIGWDAKDFRENCRRLKELRAQLTELESDDPRARAVKEELQRINNRLNGLASQQEGSKLSSSGTVVVVFRRQQDLRACLAKWGGLWAQWFYCEGGDVSFLPQGNHLCRGGELPRFPIGHPPRPVHRIRVERAANPGDINWEEIGVPWRERLVMQAKTNGAMFLLVVISFFGVYLCEWVRAFIKKSGGGVFQALVLLTVIAACILNVGIIFAARRLAVLEYHETFTGEQFSQALKMTVGITLNTAGVFYFINAQPSEWYESGGLVTEMFYMMLAFTFIKPLVSYLDPGYQIRRFGRGKLTQEKLDKMNESLLKPSPEHAERYRDALNQKMYFLKQFAPSELDNARRYALALTTFIVCLVFTPVFPLFSLLGLVGIVLQYWVDKYMLLRWYKRPEKPANAYMPMLTTRLMKLFVPSLFTVAVFVFLTPSWETKSQVGGNVVISFIISGCFALLPLETMARTLLKCLRRIDPDSDKHGLDDYYVAQHMWAKGMKYHKDHFIYKLLAEDKNPEILSPDTGSVKVDDVRATYGVVVKTAASWTAAPTTTVIGGGHVIETGPRTQSLSSRGAEGGAAAAAAPGPTLYGAGAPVAPPAGGSDASDHVPLVGAPTSSAKSRTPAPVLWHYEFNGTWSPFASDCQSFIEARYKSFAEGSGNAQVSVSTRGTTMSVNFQKMTSKKVDSATIRPIRRTESD